ncbi:MAG: type I pantothenate kinase [Acidimicrobiales bacterium]
MADVARLAATGDPISLDEVEEIYVPLGQLLAVYSSAERAARQRVDGFLDRPNPATPFVIGVAGSVAVGKSTTARLLQAVLRDGPGHPPVELITTDGFLYPNAELEARGLMDRKGFPESYDRRRMIDVLSAIKAGRPRVEIPVYSHVTYDIVPGEFQTVATRRW